MPNGRSSPLAEISPVKAMDAYLMNNNMSMAPGYGRDICAENERPWTIWDREAVYVVMAVMYFL